MSLTVYLRNLHIEYPEHQNLLDDDSKKTVQFFEKEFARIQKVLNNNKDKSLEGMILARLKPNTHFAIVIDSKKQNNPYCTIILAGSSFENKENVSIDMVKAIKTKKFQDRLHDRIDEFVFNLKFSDFANIPLNSIKIQNKIETSAYRGWDIKGGIKL